MATISHLRIAFLLDTSLDPDDGVQQYILALGTWLESKGHTVSFIVGETKNRQLKNLYSLARNFNVTFNGNKTTIPLPTSNKKIKNFLDQHEFDVIHVQSPHSPFLSQKVIKNAPKSTVIIGTFHILPYGHLATLGNKLLGLVLRSSLKRIDKMLAVSESASIFCKQSFHINSEVLPNVIDYKRFNGAISRAEFNDNKLNILFLGRLVRRKGCQTLIEAVSQLNDSAKDNIRLIICGKGELKDDLEGLVKKFKLDKFTVFEGYVSEDDKPSYYASADIAVFPSISGESFGIVLLEAMVSGKAAVLAGDNPGYATVMKPQPDLLFDPKNSTELTQKITELISNTPLREKYAKWGSDYTKNFDVNVIGHKLAKIYHDEIAKKQRLKHN